MSKPPYNAGQTIKVDHLVYGPISTVDFGKITVTENWGRLFIRCLDKEVVIERGAYVALRDAINHFIERETPPDPRDEVIARLVEALEAMHCAFMPFSDDEFRAVYETDAALAAAKAVQK